MWLLAFGVHDVSGDLLACYFSFVSLWLLRAEGLQTLAHGAHRARGFFLPTQFPSFLALKTAPIPINFCPIFNPRQLKQFAIFQSSWLRNVKFLFTWQIIEVFLPLSPTWHIFSHFLKMICNISKYIKIFKNNHIYPTPMLVNHCQVNQTRGWGGETRTDHWWDDTFWWFLRMSHHCQSWDAPITPISQHEDATDPPIQEVVCCKQPRGKSRWLLGTPVHVPNMALTQTHTSKKYLFKQNRGNMHIFLGKGLSFPVGRNLFTKKGTIIYTRV